MAGGFSLYPMNHKKLLFGCGALNPQAYARTIHHDQPVVAEHPEEVIDQELAKLAFESIRPGDLVTILVPAGKGLHGQQWVARSGRAVICGQRSTGVIALNLGGPYGIPGCATPENLVQVRKPGKMIPEIIPPISAPELGRLVHESKVRVQCRDSTAMFQEIP